MTSLGWATEVACKSLILAAATFALLLVAKRRSAAERAVIGDAGLLSLVALPPLLLILTRVHIAPPVPVALALHYLVHKPAGSSTGSPIATAAYTSAGAAASGDWKIVAVLAYLLPALVLATALLLAVVRLGGLGRRARVVEDARWLTALAAAQNRVGVKHGTALLISDDVKSPISWGVVRPVIMIDADSGASPDQAGPVIAHELAHVQRLDWLKLIVARLALAVFWFNPLVWVLARKCHELREEAADDAVLGASVGKSDYADVLLTASRHANAWPLLAANGVAPSTGSLSRRVRRVLEGSNNRLPARRTWKLACLAVTLAVNAPLAAITWSDQPATHPSNSLPKAQSPRTEGGAPSSTTSLRLNNPSSPPPDPADLGYGPTGKLMAQAPRLFPPPPVAPAGDIDSPVFAEAMIAASRHGDVGTLRRLIAHGGSPNAVLRGDGTPLIAAVRAGRMKVATFLLANGAKASLGVPGDGNPLIVAARAGRRDLVELLLARGAGVDDVVPGDGTALIVASASGRLDIARLLLEHHANIEQIAPDEENALIAASRAGQGELVQLLIEHGADVNREVFGRTPLSMAQLRGYGSIAEILRTAGAVR